MLVTTSYHQRYVLAHNATDVPQRGSGAVLVRENKAGANSLAAVRPASRGQSCRRGLGFGGGAMSSHILTFIPPEMIRRHR